MSDASPVRAGESLMLGSGRQLALLDVDEAGLPPAAYARSEDRGRWTGDRLFFAQPQIYGAICKLLARGLPYREIADILEVSVNTVCGVAYREGVPVETLRERIGKLGLDVAHLSLEAIRNLLADPLWIKEQSAKDLAIIFGISFEKAQLALGGATARIDTTLTAVPDHEAYLAYLKNVTPAATGLGAGNLGAKEGPAALQDGLGSGSAERVIDVPKDQGKQGTVES